MASGDDDLVGRLRQGDTAALAELFARHHDRLWRLVHFRMAPRMSGRVDCEDVLQDAYLAAAARLRHFLERPDGTFFIWVRLVVLQTLADLHRQHLGAQLRDAYREVPLQASPDTGATSQSMAVHLLGNLTSPSQ